MEETSDHGRRESVAPPASSPENTTEGPSSSMPSASEVRVNGENNDRDGEESGDSIRTSSRQQQPHSSQGSYRINFSIYNVAPSSMKDDVWSCLVVLVTFWLFAASMTLILGIFGSENLQLGNNCSRLIQTNPLFVQSIQVEEIDELKPGPSLYGFYTTPPLDIEKSWIERHIALIPPNFHKEWVHFLNQGSKVEITYSVKSTMPVSLVIARGRDSLVEWIDDPSYPDTTLSWNIINGSGKLQQEFNKASSYFIAVGNFNSEEVEVQLSFSIRALLYNTSQAYHRCSVTDHLCRLKIFFLRKNVAVLTSPSPAEGSSTDRYIKLSYCPRWITYFVGSGVMTVLILVAFKFCNVFQASGEDDDGDGSGHQDGNVEPERAPLLSRKDDDLLSWGSSYDSVSQDDDEDMEERLMMVSSAAGMEGEHNLNPSRLCVICFDAPRDCFFLPCGHCAACFACGSRIEEEAGCCPICRRKMKKVRRIFAV